MSQGDKTKTYGFEVPPKSIAELEQEYGNLAALVGHKTMLVHNTSKEVDRIQGEMTRVEGEIAAEIIKLTALRTSIDKAKHAAAAEPIPVDAPAAQETQTA